MCPHKTDGASTSVSHFVGIYSSWSEFPCLIITDGRESESRLRLLCCSFVPLRLRELTHTKLWIFISIFYLFISTWSYPGKIDRVSSFSWHILPRSSCTAVVHVHIWEPASTAKQVFCLLLGTRGEEKWDCSRRSTVTFVCVVSWMCVFYVSLWKEMYELKCPNVNSISWW